MNEYIDRDMLIAEGWHMQRTIRSMTSISIEIKKPTDFPASDVVEVIRCKDCKHFEQAECPWDELFVINVNDYCSRGERKEGKG